MSYITISTVCVNKSFQRYVSCGGVCVQLRLRCLCAGEKEALV